MWLKDKILISPVLAGLLLVQMPGAQLASTEELGEIFSAEGFKRGEDAAVVAKGEEARRFLEEKLASTAPFDREKAVHLLGKMGGSDSIDAIAPLLGDPDENVSFRAALALGYTRTPAALEPLYTALEPGDYHLAQPILSSILRIGDASSLAPLEAFSNACDASREQQALKARADRVASVIDRYHGDAETRDTLLRALLTASDPEDIQWALRRIRELRAREFSQTVSKLSKRLEKTSGGADLREEVRETLRDLQ